MNPPEFFLKAGLEGNSLVAQIPIYGGVTRSWQNPPGWGFLVSELQHVHAKNFFPSLITTQSLKGEDNSW